LFGWSKFLFFHPDVLFFNFIVATGDSSGMSSPLKLVRPAALLSKGRGMPSLHASFVRGRPANTSVKPRPVAATSNTARPSNFDGLTGEVIMPGDAEYPRAVDQ
jgi:hypothetical protein